MLPVALHLTISVRMKRIDLLKKEFQNSKIEFGNEILTNLSTKTEDGKIFPPYIPFVGNNYKEYKILFYSTAQNIGFGNLRKTYQKNFIKLTERLYYFDDFRKKYPKDKMSYQNIAINPYQTGVIAALLGVYIFARYGKIIENLNEINNWIGISNYYKFSLNNGKSDINPETKISKYVNNKEQIKNYWQLNDELVKHELETLKPNIVLSFNGRKINKLKQFTGKECKVIRINDPSWILQGGSGVFKENKSWWRKANSCKDITINDLVNNYMNSISGDYERKNKKEHVKIYLLKYYSDWKK